MTQPCYKTYAPGRIVPMSHFSCGSQRGGRTLPNLRSNTRAASWVHGAANFIRLISLAAAMASMLGVASANAQSGDADLAKQLANPIASLTGVPFQNNFDCCYEPIGA
jgi:hypothetical protein